MSSHCHLSCVLFSLYFVSSLILFTFFSHICASCLLSTMPSFTPSAGLIYFLYLHLSTYFSLFTFISPFCSYLSFSPFLLPSLLTVLTEVLAGDVEPPPALISCSASTTFLSLPSSIAPSQKGLSEDGMKLDVDSR